MKISFSRLLLAITICYSFSCSKLNNQHNVLAVECQMPPSTLTEGLLRIMDENGEPLSAERLFKVQAQFQNQAGQRSPLALSSQACIRLPQEQGLVLVSLPAERKALVHSLPTSEPTFMRKNLQAASGLSTAFSCSNDGFFANKSLRHDWSFESTVNAQTLKLVVRAIREQDGQTQNLFTQDFGASTLQLPDTLDTSALREGIYRLEVDAYDLLDNFGETSRSLIKKSCPLTVLRRSPWVGGLVDTSTFAVYQPGKALPWKSEGQDSQLHACLEERTATAADSNTPSSCQPLGKCTHPEAFHAVSSITASKPGLYDIFTFARDRAGNESPVLCQTVAFSATAPDLNLAWINKLWNQEGSVMRDMDVFIRAHVQLNKHEVLSQERLKETLECKVDFVLQSKDTLSGKDVICTKGRCRGLSLADYKPCDQDIEFTLHEAWQQAAIHESVMRLHVRAQDGAGNLREVSRSIGINRRAWIMERLEYRQNGDAVSPQQLIQDTKGTSIATFEDGTIQKWDGTKWVNTTPVLPGRHQHIQLNMTAQQDIYAHFTRVMPEDKKLTGIARWNGESWIWIPSADAQSDSPFFNDCKGPYNFVKTGFYCRFADGYRHFDGQQWHPLIPLPLVERPEDSCAAAFPFVTLDSLGRLWQICADQLWVWGPEPRWRLAFNFHQGNGRSLASIFADSRGGIYALAMNMGEKILGYYSDVDSFQPLPLPPGPAGSLTSCDPGLDHENRLVCERYAWNAKQKQWEELDQFAELDYKAYPILNSDYGGVESFNPIRMPGNALRAWTAPYDGFYLESSTGLKHWPSAFTQAFLNTLTHVYRSPDGTLWLNASSGRNGTRSIYRIQPNHLLPYDEKILGLSHGMLPQFWEDTEGRMKQAFFERGIHVFKDGMWQYESPGVPGGVAHYVNFESRDGTLFASTYTEVWMRLKGDTNFKLLNEKYLGGMISRFEETDDGSVWFYADGSRVMNRVQNGKREVMALPDGSPDPILNTMVYKGKLVVITASQFYIFTKTSDSEPAFRVVTPQELGLESYVPGSTLTIMKIATDQYWVTINFPTGDKQVLIRKSHEGTWEPLVEPDPLMFGLAANSSGVMYACTPQGIHKKTEQGWKVVLPYDQLKHSLQSKDMFILWLYVDSYGRLWLNTGGPWLLSRFDG